MAIELSEKQIRDGWQIVKFGDIAKEVKSTTKDPAEDGLEFYVGLEHLEPQSPKSILKIVPQYLKDGSSLPSGWQEKKLCEIAKVERGKFTPRPRNNPIYYAKGNY
jgi:hypothetical protein